MKLFKKFAEVFQLEVESMSISTNLKWGFSKNSAKSDFEGSKLSPDSLFLSWIISILLQY